MSGETTCSAGDRACIDRTHRAGQVDFDRHGASPPYWTPDGLRTHDTELGYAVLGVVAVVLA